MRITTCGFPHSDSHGSMAICASPWIFAAYRVLLRLLMPRHSPCALLSLNFISFFFCMSIANRLFLLIAVYCFQYYFALFFGKTMIFISLITKFYFVILFFLLSYKTTFFILYRVRDLLSPILLSLSPRQFVCRYIRTIFFPYYTHISTYSFYLALLFRLGGLKWIRTTDLALIRRTL